MPTTTLDGPYSLDHETIDKKVPKGVCGVFAIGNTGQDGKFYIDRVGRSDKDLRQELYDCLGTDSQFKISRTKNSADAFFLECEIFHIIRPPMTIMHPEPPVGRVLRCRHCHALDVIK